MKRKVSLYIADTKVDLDDDSLILFNYTKDDLSNPTAVKNSYSHKVTLKGTPTNNKLFGDIFRLDRQTLYSDGFAGVFFDPMRKTPFQIFDETSAVLESGYIKLDNVSRIGNDISYTVTLYGGLGSFFYGLTYNEDGTKRTLADMTYRSIDGSRVQQFGIYPYATTVQEAWTYLQDPDSYDPYSHDFDCWNIVNFAPCYNGLPEDFDANKAVVKNKNVYVNVELTHEENGVTYSTKTGTNSRLLTFTNPHTEWELCDLRWYLQRPVISVAAIFEAICYYGNNGGYTVELDSSFFNSGNPAYSKAWITLPMITKEDRTTYDSINTLLRSTLSPAEYLLSFAKTYGLVFKYDTGRKKVSILSRNTFYQEYSDVVDLGKRINKSETIDIVPVVAKSKWYQFGGETIGQYAEEYKKDYGRAYGIQKIDTGYEFDAQISELTKGIFFKDAVDVMETNRLFTSSGFTRYGNQAYAKIFLLPAYENVTVQLWGYEPNEGAKLEETKTVESAGEWSIEFPFRASQYYRITIEGGKSSAFLQNDNGNVQTIIPEESDNTEVVFASDGNIGKIGGTTDGDNVKITIRNLTDVVESNIEIPMRAKAINFYYDNPDYEYGDWLPKVQLHGAENKTEDGANVMLLFDGMKFTPTYSNGRSKTYWLSDDTEDMKVLNNDSPCWNLTGDSIQLYSLPSFRRILQGSYGTITQSLEWGDPLARAVPDLVDVGKSIYNLWWKSYLTDLFNDDTRIMKCKVDLRGLQIGQQLLQRFFWYEGSIWVLNKISNYSMTTYDDVECEFIKVNEVSNYKNGQIEI